MWIRFVNGQFVGALARRYRRLPIAVVGAGCAIGLVLIYKGAALLAVAAMAVAFLLADMTATALDTHEEIARDKEVLNALQRGDATSEELFASLNGRGGSRIRGLPHVEQSINRLRNSGYVRLVDTPSWSDDGRAEVPLQFCLTGKGEAKAREWMTSPDPSA
jgi:hypothetical protein